jgi:hypothetical protein
VKKKLGSESGSRSRSIGPGSGRGPKNVDPQLSSMFIYYIQLIISFVIIISTGCNDGIQRQCTNCEGMGIETLIYRMGPLIQQSQRVCALCHGQGNMIDKNN